MEDAGILWRRWIACVRSLRRLGQYEALMDAELGGGKWKATSKVIAAKIEHEGLLGSYRDRYLDDDDFVFPVFVPCR